MKLKTQCFLFFLFVSVLSFAQSSAGWQDLFNGKDLKGWKVLNGHAKFEVINGEIVGTTVLNEHNSFLATEKDYGNFILEFEFRLNNKMNSGVQLDRKSTRLNSSHANISYAVF